MKRVPTQEVKQRTKQLTELFHSYEPYRKRVGQEYQVLVTEVAHDQKHYVGHNEFYEQVSAATFCSQDLYLSELEMLEHA